jgi:hypothetical protein
MDVSFRAIRPEDVDALRRFHQRLGERTIYLRFFGSMKELSKQKAKYSASVDGVDHVALVALDSEDTDEIVAVVRYDQRTQRALKSRVCGPRRRSLAGSRYRNSLDPRTDDEAKDKGVRCFYALVMGDNKRMLALLRHLDLPEQERQDEEQGVKRIEVELPSYRHLRW